MKHRTGPASHVWLRVLGSAAAILGTWLGRPNEAAAQQDVEAPDAVPARPKVSLSIEPGPCAGIALEEIVPLATIELRSQLVEVDQGADHHIVVGCAGDVVTIAVAAPGGRARFRTTDVATAPPNVRPRIIALVAAELVRNLDRAPMPPPVPPPEARRPLRDSLPTTVSSSRLGTFAEASTFGFDGDRLYGGGLRFEYARAWLCGGFDAALLSGSQRSARGTTDVLLTYLSPHVDWRWLIGRVSAQVGAGFAFGAASLVGRPADATTQGRTLGGPWMAPYGALGLAFGLTAALSIEARLHAGWVTLPVIGEAPGDRDFGVRGFFGTIQAGAALSL